MKAFVCRLGPRVVVKGQARGTLIDPINPGSSDQSDYFTSTVMQGTLPDQLTVEFGQPPKRQNSHTLATDDMIILLLGATDFRGSTNKRGVVGVGRVADLEYSGQGPSERCKMTVSRIVAFNPLIDLRVLQAQEWFGPSELLHVPAFGFSGKTPAQNILKCYMDKWSAEEIDMQVRSILGTFQGADPGFSDRLALKDPELGNLVPPIDPEWEPREATSTESRRSEASARPPQTVEELAERLYLPVVSVLEMIWVLEKKQSLILSGPPGVGKTYIAREISQFMFGTNVDFVQFHPSYSYEYFVSGYRPSIESETLKYDLSSGPLLDILHDAESAESDVRFGLIIDEINRSNVSAVFGELLTALEYRGIPVRLQYGSPYDERGEFIVPDNFYIVATMNRADRSAGNFDAALRRRFGFFDCYPTEEPFRSVLRKFIESKDHDQAWIANWINEINELIPDPDFSIGASFFMGSIELSDDEISRIFKFELTPYLHGKFGSSSAFEFLLNLSPDVARNRYSDPITQSTDSATEAALGDANQA